MLTVDPDRPSDTRTEPHEITHAPDALRGFAVSFARPAPREEVSVTGTWPSDLWEDYLSASPEERAYLLRRYGHPKGS